MGYGVMAFAVDLDRLRRTVAEPSSDFLAMAVEQFGSRDSVNELLSDYAGLAGPPLPTAGEVMTHILTGAPYDERVGFAYAYAVEYLVGRHGIRLDNSGWYPLPSAWVDLVQQELGRLGVSDRDVPLSTLVWGGSPVPVPTISDFPGVGYLEADAVATGHTALRSVSPDGIEDADLRLAVTNLAGWFADAAGWDRGLVTYYY